MISLNKSSVLRILIVLFYFIEGQTIGFGQKYYPLPKRFDDCAKPPLTNYAEDKNWAALPWKQDYADKTPNGLENNQDSAKADVFYIHPTTYRNKPINEFLWNADVTNEVENEAIEKSPIQYQASIFNGSCKVYAPRYRQAHFYCFKTPHLTDKWKALDCAYEDVRNAFLHYLKHYNHGRPIVIASHSQGTIHAHKILQEFFSDTLKSKLVVAYIIGMPVPKDSLPKIDFCKVPNQTQCWVSWSSYERNFIPENYHVALERAICINPLTWKYDEQYAAAELNKGAVLVPFQKVLSKRCDAQVNGGILWVTKPKFRGSFLYTNSNYHIADMNFFYMDIRENVAQRIEHFISTK
jgi:hypothetical protein